MLTDRFGSGVLVALAAASALLVGHAQEPMTIQRAGALVMSPPAGQSGRGLILGRVVDAATGRPIAGASVTAGASGPPAMAVTGLAAPAPPSSMTNGEGYFLLRDLPKGSYPLSVIAPGYVQGSYGRRQPEGPSRVLVLEQDQRVTDVVIRLWKFGAISGTVVDESGEPGIGVTVQAVRRTGSGRLAGVPGSQTQTDDRGAYRIASIVPGAYFISVPATTTSIPMDLGEILRQPTSPAAMNLRRDLPLSMIPMSFGLIGTEGIRVGDAQLQPNTRGGSAPPPSANGRIAAYQTVFHPSATSPGTATVVGVESGQERADVDIQLRLVPTSRVSGRVVGPDGPAAHIGLRLTPVFAEALSADVFFETSLTVAGGDGRFTFLGVPPGQYVVKALRIPRPQSSGGGAAQAVQTVISFGDGGGFMSMGLGSAIPGPLPPASTDPTLWAEAPISVADRDIDELTLTLKPGARLSGHLVFEGGARPALADLPRLAIGLVSADDRTNPLPPNVPIDGEYRFTTAEYPAGRYLVNVSPLPAGWTLKSAVVAGRNALERPVDLAADDLTGVVITLTTRPTEISGTVRRTSGTGDPNAIVFVFPADHQTWIDEGMANRRMRTADANPNGTFQVSGLIAGEYSIAAVGAEAIVDIRNPATVSALARIATRVSVTDGEKRTVALAVSPLR